MTHDDFKTTSGKDLFSLIIGDKIGSGIGRTVYENRINSDTVIKIEEESYQNIKEWEFWQDVQYSDISKWFAPCLSISPCGIFLVQTKCEPLPKKMYPRKLPKFMADIKYENFGYLNGKIVCFDYGTIYTKLIANTSKKMIDVKWK